MNRYSHWRTPKLEAELAAVKKLGLWNNPQHYPKAGKSLLALESRHYSETASEIEAVLKKRRKK